jgi:hypothetical protein
MEGSDFDDGCEEDAEDVHTGGPSKDCCESFSLEEFK